MGELPDAPHGGPGERALNLRRGRTGLAPTAAAIVASILPVFLLGSLSVQIRDELGHGEATTGLVLASFFAASAVVSSRVGRWVDRVGPRHALRAALCGTVLVQAGIAVAARAPWSLALFAAMGGLCNATAQLGANVFIARCLPVERQGIGFAVKQSAMPGASLLAGVALPMIAIPFGWRWVFLAASVLTAAVVLVLPWVPEGRGVQTGPGEGADGRSASAAPTPKGLVSMAVATAFATAAAITLGGFFVESAIDARVHAATAGLLFSAGSVISIVVRMAVGAFADRRSGDMLGVVAAMLALGALTSVWFTWRDPSIHLIGVPLAFGAGWAWPGLFNLAVVRAAPDAPGRATGITQTGTYVGGTAGPLVFGTIAETTSFAAAWWLAAVFGLTASVLVLVGRRAMQTERLRSPGPLPASTRP